MLNTARVRAPLDSVRRAARAHRAASGPRALNALVLLPFAALGLGCGQADSAAPEPECAVVDDNACPDATLSYDSGIGALITQRCSPCHAPGGIDATRLLTDYDHVSGARMSIAFQLSTCAMPPVGSPAFRAGERERILGWLSCGAPR